MADHDPELQRIVRDNPISGRLDAFRASFHPGADGAPNALELLDQEELTNRAFDLLSALQSCPAARRIPLSGRDKNIFASLARLGIALVSDEIDVHRIKPLLRVASTLDIADIAIWKQAIAIITEATPPPKPTSTPFLQTPWRYTTSGVVDSSELRENIDKVLRSELLGALYCDVPGFRDVYFGRVPDLHTISSAVFARCCDGDDPLFRSPGWRSWPAGAKEQDVLPWLLDLCSRIEAFARMPGHGWTATTPPLQLVGEPRASVQGSTARRMVDVGFIRASGTAADGGGDSNSRSATGLRHWNQFVIPGELKSNPADDTVHKAWLDLARYGWEVFASQATRRFVLGFTLCGSLMRIWAFDRVGGVSSERFDINEDGQQFVSTMLGFLSLNNEGLGFDPTFTWEDGRQIVTIARQGRAERLIVDELVSRSRCISGRGGTCWRAHHEDDLQKTPLVIKDSWQYTERGEEGALLQLAQEKGVANVARYYHHEDVLVQGRIDDVRSSIRGNLDMTNASNYRQMRHVRHPPAPSLPIFHRQSSSLNATGDPWTARTSSKRPSSHSHRLQPPAKRSRLTSPAQASGDKPVINRVHRRIVVRDFGKPIYKASAVPALLSALAGCIEGHRALLQAGILHRDVSVNNLLINENVENPSWKSFLIDLDLAILVNRTSASGATEKTGTRAFMAIGALSGKPHTFMHDLESFFWVLFWICIHYDKHGHGKQVADFDEWNYMATETLATLKSGTVLDEERFLYYAEKYFTPDYQAVVPWINRLRQLVFPDRKVRDAEDMGLYSQMIALLNRAAEDLRSETGTG